jgi:hypothetical protein
MDEEYQTKGKREGRMMSLKYAALVLVLLIFVILLGLQNYETWTQPLKQVQPKEATKSPAKKTETPLVTGENKETTSIRSYISISEKNIFSPERKDFPVATATIEGKKPIVRPQVVLYGITILGDFQTASVVNPGRPLKKGERETMTLKVGDRVGEYKITKISPDRITLDAGEDRFEVLLYDPSMPKKRVVPARPSTVTSTAPAPGQIPAPAGTVNPNVPAETGAPREPNQQPAVAPQMPSIPPVTSPLPPPRSRRGIYPQIGVNPTPEPGVN